MQPYEHENSVKIFAQNSDNVVDLGSYFIWLKQAREDRSRLEDSYRRPQPVPDSGRA